MKSLLSLWLLLTAESTALFDTSVKSDTLLHKATHETKGISRQAPAPMIMPGVRLDKHFNVLPAQSPAVGQAGAAWPTAKVGGSPMYVVDGKGATAGQLKALSQQDVVSVSLLEGSRAVALYGKNARNGMVVITTKKGLRP